MSSECIPTLDPQRNKRNIQNSRKSPGLNHAHEGKEGFLVLVRQLQQFVK